MAGRPVTAQTEADVRRLHAKGLSRNAIARELKRSGRTISIIAERLGLTFDRTATAVATEARVIDGKARRAALTLRAYARAEKLYDRLEADDTDGYKFTATTVNGIETRTLDHVPAQDEKALAGAASAQIAIATRLEALDTDNGAGEVGSLLTGLFDRLRDRHGDG